MPRSHSAQIPTSAALYFHGDHPVITGEFHPSRGWRSQSFRKRVSASWLRKLRKEGVTHVALTSEGRSADFSIAELLSSTAR